MLLIPGPAGVLANNSSGRIRFTYRIRVICCWFWKLGAANSVWVKCGPISLLIAGVLGLVHDAHSTTTKLLDGPVVGDGLADEHVGVRHSVAMLGCTLG